MVAAGGTLTAIRLGPADAEACVRLSAAAGWGHEVADWRRRLSVGLGFGSVVDGILVAAGVAFPAPPRCGWFGMLLVDPAQRGRGLGAQLTERAVAELAGLGIEPTALFAVPKAVGLYQRLGFRRIGGLASFRGEARPAGTLPAPGLRIRAVAAGDRAALLALDLAVYGADRSAMLADQIDRFPDRALVVEAGGRIAGFGLAARRIGELVVGPVVAPDGAAALALFDRLIEGHAGPVRCDSLGLDQDDDRRDFQAALLRRGLEPRADIPLMVRGRSDGTLPFGDPRRLFAAQSAAAG